MGGSGTIGQAQAAAQRTTDLLNAVPSGGWRGPDEPRLAPLAVSAQRRWQKVFLRFLTEHKGVPATNLFATLLRAPRLFMSWLLFASRLMPYGNLPRRLTELVILRAAWCSRCAYEWHQHVRIGQQIGLDADDIERVMAGPSVGGWTDKEAAVLWAVDDIVDSGALSAPRWTLLAAQFSNRQLIEIVMLASHYRMLAAVIDSLGIQVEQGE